MSYSAEIRKSWFTLSNNYEIIAKTWLELSKFAKDKDEKLLLLGLEDICSTLSNLLMITVNQLQDLNALFDAFEKLPKNKEFDELKAGMESIKENHLEVAVQVPKELEKELKEWLAERERAKKAQGQYVS